MKKGNVNGALKLLTKNIKDGILPLNGKTLNNLKEKHPKSKHANVLLTGVPFHRESTQSNLEVSTRK